MIEPPKRRTFQFSLRTLMGVVVLLAVTCWAGTTWRARERSQRYREAITELDKVKASYKTDADGNVTEVLLGGDRITNDTLVCLKAFRRLTKVDVRCTPNVNDEGLATLGELSTLRVLWFEYVPITDRGMIYIQRLSNLEDLFLGPYKSEFKDDGLVYLKDLKSLRHLTITANARVSIDAIKKLRADLRGCRIEWRKEIDENGGAKPSTADRQPD